MEVRRLGAKSELWLPAYTTACGQLGIQASVCDLHHSSWQHQIPNPLSKARDRTCVLMDTSWVLNGLSYNGNSCHGICLNPRLVTCLLPAATSLLQLVGPGPPSGIFGVISHQRWPMTSHCWMVSGKPSQTRILTGIQAFHAKMRRQCGDLHGLSPWKIPWV